MTRKQSKRSKKQQKSSYDDHVDDLPLSYSFFRLSPTLAFNLEAGTVTCGGEEKPLTTHEVRLLSALVETYYASPARWCNINRLIKCVYPGVYKPSRPRHSIHVKIGVLREKLGEAKKKPRFLVSHPCGLGYHLCPSPQDRYTAPPLPLKMSEKMTPQ